MLAVLRCSGTKLVGLSGIVSATCVCVPSDAMAGTCLGWAHQDGQFRVASNALPPTMPVGGVMPVVKCGGRFERFAFATHRLETCAEPLVVRTDVWDGRLYGVIEPGAEASDSLTRADCRMGFGSRDSAPLSFEVKLDYDFGPQHTAVARPEDRALHIVRSVANAGQPVRWYLYDLLDATHDSEPYWRGDGVRVMDIYGNVDAVVEVAGANGRCRLVDAKGDVMVEVDLTPTSDDTTTCLTINGVAWDVHWH